MMEVCKEHSTITQILGRIEQKCESLASDIGRLDKRINGSFDRIGKHVDEGERPGGFRERLAKIEQIVETIAQEKLNSTKAAQWRIGIVAGLPGTLLALIKMLEWLR